MRPWTSWALRRSSPSSSSSVNKAWIPCALTVLGAAFSIAWVYHLAPWWAAVVGLLLDVADGTLARRLHATTEYGGLLDWTVDVVLFALAADRLTPELAGPLLLVALPVQVALRSRGIHFCGRALAFLVGIGCEISQ